MNESLDLVMGYARSIWRRRWLVIGLAWLVALVGWVWVYSLENQYQAQARVYVDTQSLLKPLLTGLAVQPDLDQQVVMMTRTLASRPNLEKVARMTDLDLRAKTPKQQEDLYESLADRIKLQGTERENLYTISYQHANADLAKRVVQALLTIFTENSLGGTRKDLSNTQKFIEDQLKAYEAKLIEKEKQLEEFKRRNVGTMPGQGTDYYAKLNELNLALEQAKAELEEAVSRKKQLQQQLDDQEGVLSAPAPANATATALDGRIATLQNQLDTLRLKYTDLHPDIMRTKQLIARLEEQKKQEEKDVKAASQESGKSQNPVYQQLTIAIAEADATVASLTARVNKHVHKRDELYRAVDRIPQLEGEYTQLMRDYDVYKKNYEQLLERRESATMAGEVESKTDVVDFRVVDPPRASNVPAWPNRPLLVTLVPFAGVGLGVALAFLLAQIRPTVQGRRELSRFTDIPLLGVVSRVRSEDQVRALRKRDLYFAAASGMLALAYLIQMVYYLILSPAA